MSNSDGNATSFVRSYIVELDFVDLKQIKDYFPFMQTLNKKDQTVNENDISRRITAFMQGSPSTDKDSKFYIPNTRSFQ